MRVQNIYCRNLPLGDTNVNASKVILFFLAQSALPLLKASQFPLRNSMFFYNQVHGYGMVGLCDPLLGMNFSQAN